MFLLVFFGSYLHMAYFISPLTSLNHTNNTLLGTIIIVTTVTVIFVTINTFTIISIVILFVSSYFIICAIYSFIHFY